MRFELIPVIIGLVVGVAGLALIADALIPAGAFAGTERRRRERPERHRVGAALLGTGVVFVAAALVGGDSWRYTTLAVVIAVVLIGVGVVLNRKYVRGLMFGPSAGRVLKRRVSDSEVAQPEPREKKPPMRLR